MKFTSEPDKYQLYHFHVRGWRFFEFYLLSSLKAVRRYPANTCLLGPLYHHINIWSRSVIHDYTEQRWNAISISRFEKLAIFYTSSRTMWPLLTASFFCRTQPGVFNCLSKFFNSISTVFNLLWKLFLILRIVGRAFKMIKRLRGRVS